jgi:hypothetical protein
MVGKSVTLEAKRIVGRGHSCFPNLPVLTSVSAHQ